MFIILSYVVFLIRQCLTDFLYINSQKAERINITGPVRNDRYILSGKKIV